MLVAGEEEMKTGMVDVRKREGGRGSKMRVDEFAAMVAKEKPDVSHHGYNLYKNAWSPENYEEGVVVEESKEAPKQKEAKTDEKDLAVLEARLSKS